MCSCRTCAGPPSESKLIARAAAAALSDGHSPAELAAHREQFFAALADDFNTPRALASLHGWLSDVADHPGAGNDDLVQMLTVLGLETLLLPDANAAEPDAAALALLAAREEARAAKDWELADSLRDQLALLGWGVRDGDDGAKLVAL